MSLEDRILALEYSLAEVKAELEIRNVIARYGLAADCGDIGTALDCHTEDAIYVVSAPRAGRGGDAPDLELKGHMAIRDMLGSDMHQSLLPNCAHTVGPLVVSFNGKNAVVTGYSRVYFKDAEKPELMRLAFNQWTMHSEEGRWKIARRESRVMGKAETMTPFRGWHVLGGSFVNAMLLAGATIYSFGLFVQPVEAEFGLSREQANLGYIAFYLTMAFWAVLIGQLHKRISARLLTICGVLGFALGFVMIATATTPLTMVLAILFPIGLGFTAAGPFTANVLATRWFTRMRGRALGIAAVATSMGGFVMVPIFARLFDAYGWRHATLIMAAAVLVIVTVLSVLFIISKPEEIGQYPDGDTEYTPEDQKDTARRGFISNPNFWLIGISTGLLLGSDQALLASLIPYGMEQGFSRQQAALVMSVMTGSAVAGKLVVGWLAERWDKRLLFGLVCLSNIIFLIALLFSPGLNAMFAVAAFVGLAIGGVYPVWTTITAQCFGRDQFSAVIGGMNLITVPAMVISVGLAGRTHDMTGDYNLAFKIFIPQVILSALIILFVNVKRGTDEK